ncbi:MAG: tetratricopeptide repeat protein [candidate division WOR-3 bacterium]|nr:MAG: tetratricopeptide repeat protein [candidate division WOR-3 bacterium]
MITVFFLLFSDPTCNIDSLEAALARDTRLSTVLALNTCYLRRGDYDKGLELLSRVEEQLPLDDRPSIGLQRGDNFLFSAKPLDAREAYLKLVSEHPHDERANDALERLYLIEKTRKNMSLLTRLTRAMGLVHTRQYGLAEDSLLALIRTDKSGYAHTFLARVYIEQDKLPLALTTFKTLTAKFPDHTLDHARITHGMLYLQTGDTLNAKAVFEDMILRNPGSLYADRAREILRNMAEYVPAPRSGQKIDPSQSR